MIYGVIKFYHPEIDHMEEVLCETEAEMQENLVHSLETGFPAEQIFCWVRDETAANRLFSIMDAHGSRGRIFQLHISNLNYGLM